MRPNLSPWFELQRIRYGAAILGAPHADSIDLDENHLDSTKDLLQV